MLKLVELLVILVFIKTLYVELVMNVGGMGILVGVLVGVVVVGFM